MIKYQKLVDKDARFRNYNERVPNQGTGQGAEQAPSQNPSGIDIKSLTEDQINELIAQDISLEQIVEFAKAEQQELSPILKSMLEQKLNPKSAQQTMGQQNAQEPPMQMPKNHKNSNKFPSLMDVKTYNQYQESVKEEKKYNIQEHKPNIYGYTFSPLISEEIMQNMRRTQGSFFVGVNISNLLNTFRDMVVNSEKKDYKPIHSPMLKSNPDSIFNKIGEWLDVSLEDILKKKWGSVVQIYHLYQKKN